MSANCRQVSKPFYKLTNKADTLEIDIEGVIGGGWWPEENDATKEQVKKLLKDVSNSAASHITVNINSYGGDVNHGVSIHDMLAEHKAKVTTVVHGHTASAATIIAQAGDIRKISDNALYLIHPASILTWGNQSDLRTALSDLEKVDQTIASIYAKRTKKDEKEIREMMNRFEGRGEWLTASEALDLGLVDEIFEPMKAVASVDPKMLAHFALPELPTNKLNEMKADKTTVFAWFKEFTSKITGSQEVEEPVVETPETPEPEVTEEVAETPTEQVEETTSNTVTIRDMQEVQDVLTDLTTQNEQLTAAITERETKITNLQDEVARLKGTPTPTDAKEDPFLDKSNLKTNEEAHESNAAALRG